VNPDEKNEFIDSHLVAHDLTVVATSVVAGGVGTLVGGSAEGLLGAGVALAVGVTALSVSPMRRGINRLALKAVEASSPHTRPQD
jgi:hypothetical protein